VQREWEPEELVAAWTLVEADERELVAYKRGATRLGFAHWAALESQTQAG